MNARFEAMKNGTGFETTTQLGELIAKVGADLNQVAEDPRRI